MKDFATNAKLSFNGMKGQKESLYQHTLFSILIRKVDEWNKESGMGYDYFSLQGPEHINSVAKYSLMSRSNLHFSHLEGEYDSFERILRISRIKLYYFVEINNTRGHVRDAIRKLEFEHDELTAACS